MIDWYSTVRVKRKRVQELIAVGVANLASTGSHTVKVKLTRRGRKLLKTARRLKVDERASFAASGASQIHDRKTVTLRR